MQNSFQFLVTHKVENGIPTTTTTTRAYLTKHHMGIFCLGFASFQVLHQSAKGGKKKREYTTQKYLGLYIYHAFALKKNTYNNNNINNQKKFVIMDMATTKGIKPIPKF